MTITARESDVLHYDMSARIAIRVRFQRFGKTIDFNFYC